MGVIEYLVNLFWSSRDYRWVWRTLPIPI